MIGESLLPIDPEDKNYVINTVSIDNSANTTNSKNSNNKKYDIIIIPYNFKNNNYSISDEEIEDYENKDYLLNTLYQFNNEPIFIFDSPYTPRFYEIIIIYFVFILISLVLLYLLLLVIILFSFNPIIIFFAYTFLAKVFGLFKNIKNTFYEKSKKKAIIKKLKEKNNSTYCKEHRLKWNIGLSAYWLELVKLK